MSECVCVCVCARARARARVQSYFDMVRVDSNVCACCTFRVYGKGRQLQIASHGQSHIKITVVCPSVRNGRSAETGLTPRHTLLYLCPRGVRSQDSTITTNGGHGTSYKHEG